MFSGQAVELHTGLDRDVAQTIDELFDTHSEALVIGVTENPATGEPRIRIFSKAPEEGGTLFPYLSVLLRELVSRHEQKSRQLPAHSTPEPG